MYHIDIEPKVLYNIIFVYILFRYLAGRLIYIDIKIIFLYIFFLYLMTNYIKTYRKTIFENRLKNSISKIMAI